MKKTSKIIVMICLLLILGIVLLIPPQVKAVFMPGVMAEGKYGDTCVCPIMIIYNCTCDIGPIE